MLTFRAEQAEAVEVLRSSLSQHWTPCCRLIGVMIYTKTALYSSISESFTVTAFITMFYGILLPLF